MNDSLRSHAEMSWTYLFLSQTRPIGSFTTTPRSGSVLVQVGPSEPWSAALKLSVAQQLARFWIGGETRIATEPGHEAEGWWFSEGVARYFATKVLAHAGLLGPDDVRQAIAGELSVLATSPLRGKTNAELAALAKTDDVARATIMARGALYAVRESGAIRSRTKGQRGLEATLADLVEHAEDDKQRTFTLGAWIDALGKDDPDAAKTFDAFIVKGAPVTLPNGALGPCFRAGTGEYIAYDPGFDVEATQASSDARVTGVREGGPAAKAGLLNGDVVESMTMRDGDVDVLVKLVVGRAGAHVSIAYAPKGARGRGQTWTRIRGIADDRCGDTL
jgi:predicted metalloprotease with PDZ domain